MSATDSWWEALERADCSPQGRPWDYFARCPVHRGDGRSLHVTVGSDGRVIIHCFAHQCEAEAIAHALDMPMSALFPPGHHRARRRKLRDARRHDFHGTVRDLVNVLAALETLGAEWFGEIRFDCPHCGSPAAILLRTDAGLSYSCPGDAEAEALGYGACTWGQAKQALAAQLTNARAVAA